jgi:hypothetical protein
MEPPTVRMQRDKATQVAMVVSGVTVMATVAAGTRTPPTPNPERVPSATARRGVSGVTVARAPPKAAVRKSLVLGLLDSRNWKTGRVGLTHEDSSKDQKLAVMALEPR